jgi:hypothetical protein
VDADEPLRWDEHGWVPFEAIKRAEAIYQGKNFNPGQTCDLQLAMAPIEEQS